MDEMKDGGRAVDIGENRFWLYFVIAIGASVIGLTACIASYYGYVANRIASSSDPIATACAIQSDMRHSSACTAFMVRAK